MKESCNTFSFSAFFDLRNQLDYLSFIGAFGERLYAVNVQRHVGNNLAWLEVMRRETLSTSKLSFRGLVLTGWSRYDHFAVLCELLPIALHSGVNSSILRRINYRLQHKESKKNIKRFFL